MKCETINLKKGSTGSLVVELQTKLKKDGYYKAAVDGIFGVKTENAVKALQKKNGNTADGWFGPKTCTKAGYNTPIANSTPASQALGEIYCNTVNIKSGSTGSQVSLLQSKLINTGYSYVKINAICDTNTVKAIKALQKKQGNSEDGVFGPKTCKKTGWFKDSKITITSTSTTTAPSTTTTTTPSTSTSTTSTQLPTTKTLPVYVFNQGDAISCGPTSSCIAFSYYDIVTPSNFSASKKKIMNLAGTGNSGTNPDSLVTAISKFNSNYRMEQHAYDGMPILKKFIGNNNPCLAHINTTPALGYQGVYGHYIAVTGYNTTNNTVRIVDPSRTSYGARFIALNVLTQAIKSRGHATPIKPLIKK